MINPRGASPAHWRYSLPVGVKDTEHPGGIGSDGDGALKPLPRVVGGRYEFLAPLGRGGSATVWRALEKATGREVAI